MCELGSWISELDMLGRHVAVHALAAGVRQALPKVGEERLEPAQSLLSAIEQWCVERTSERGDAVQSQLDRWRSIPRGSPTHVRWLYVDLLEQLADLVVGEWEHPLGEDLALMTLSDNVRSLLFDHDTRAAIEYMSPN